MSIMEIKNHEPDPGMAVLFYANEYQCVAAAWIP